MAYPSLRDAHESLGGVFGARKGSMPESYGDPAAEAGAARAALGVFDRSDIGKLMLRGKDAADYLHRRLSNSVNSLAACQGCEAALLEGDARMIATLSLHRLEDGLFALTPAELADTFREAIEKYILADDVEAEDQRGEWCAIHALGPRCGEWSVSLCPDSPAEMARFEIAETSFAGAGARICRLDLGRIEGRLLLARPADAPDVWRQAFERARALGGGPCGSDALDTLRVEEGEPRYGAEWNERTIPLEAGLKRLLDYEKGCYPGQEFIARITNLGHPARVLAGLRIVEGGGESGEELFSDGQDAGAITSAAASPSLGAIALARVKWEYRQPGAQLDLAGGGRAVVAALPFDFESL